MGEELRLEGGAGSTQVFYLGAVEAISPQTSILLLLRVRGSYLDLCHMERRFTRVLAYLTQHV